MKILIDENMPYAKALFHPFGEVIAKAGRTLCADDLVDVDALLIRSVTKVNQKLLAKANRLAFVGTATAGVDHLDLELLRQRNIAFACAPGCNKIGVAEYVLSALQILARKQGFKLTERCVGIVGAGQVGSYLAACLEALAIPYLLCDPFKAQSDNGTKYHALETVLTRCDVISLHTPLTFDGPHPTHHLINAQKLAMLAPNAILLNAARGSVVDNQALKNHLMQQGAQSQFVAILDVFEHEPLVDLALLPLLTFATPHIAGYGLEGKARGTLMIYEAFCQFIGHQAPPPTLASLLPAAPFAKVWLTKPWQDDELFTLSQLVYDIRRDDSEFRLAMQDEANQRLTFDRLRKNYWDRREYSAVTVASKAEFGLKSLAKLGFSTEEIA